VVALPFGSLRERSWREAAHCSWQVGGKYRWHADLMGVSVDDTGQVGAQGMTMRNVTLPSVANTETTIRPGHHRLADGCLARLDVELGRYVGRLYAADLTVREVVVGTQEHVSQRMRHWRW
jgi:hypothetical protein